MFLPFILNIVMFIDCKLKPNNTGKILTYFEVKLAALILKKVALDSAATALAFKNNKGKYISSVSALKR